MNKTLSVNIGGIVFHIEEQAYDKLRRYLDAIRGYFTTSDGRDEIIQDIEGRIGEMLQERMTPGKQVVVDSDVDQVIDTMGRPEQFAAVNEEPAPAFAAPSAETRRAYRKLYRDPDDRVISGVSSGLAHYMGIDPIWIRLAFAIAFFMFGSGLLLYIILAVIMPKAETTAEKLEMKGEQVNISNIRRTVEGESDRQPRSGAARFFDALGQLIAGAFRLLGKLIAVFFIIIGIIILASFIIALLALLGVGGISIPIFITDLFVEPWQQTMGMVGGFLVVGIPLIMLIFLAFKMLFKVKLESRILSYTALALWIMGIIFCLGVVITLAEEFSKKESHRVEIPIVQPMSDTLYLQLDQSATEDEYRFSFDGNRNHDDWTVTSGEDSIRFDQVRLNVIRSSSNEFELVQIVSAHGPSRRVALDNARNVDYTVNQQDSLLRFSEYYVIPKGTKFRNQKVQLLLKVPEGKSVYLSEELEDIIYDIENVTNTYDGDMIGKTWTMTSRGLECVGCALPDERRRDNDDIRIRINDKGVKVEGIENGKDTTYSIDGDDVNINIGNDGVQIDAKKR
jgi:phage shock protein PspC (stress-responsive transcriptional regulator)